MAGSKTAGFRVIVVGGGIAGLTIANALQAAGIDFILLEGRGDRTPPFGGVVLIDPASARILDQLGCYKSLEGQTMPMMLENVMYPNGDLLPLPKDTLSFWASRFGYDMRIMERWKIIKILTGHIESFQDKILLNKRVIRVKHTETEVIVHCGDGTAYHGELVLGCDGVHSRVRQEMWNAADVAQPGEIPASEKTSATAEYRILYGVSPPNPLFKPGSINLTYGHDTSPAVMCGDDGELSIFVAQKLPTKIQGKDFPRYTENDVAEFAESIANASVQVNGAVKFKDIWSTRRRYNLNPVIESAYEHWSWGRFGLVGESCILQSPNAGMGANCAIENAAATANAIFSVVTEAQKRGKSKPDYDDLQAALKSAREVRRARVDAAISASKLMIRAHVLAGFPHRMMLALAPYMTNFKFDMVADTVVGGTLLKFLPIPPRSMNGTLPFNPEQGVGTEESKTYRALKALPLLVIAIFAYFKLHGMVPMDQIQMGVAQGTLQHGNTTVELLSDLSRIPAFDAFAQGGVVAFSPSWLGTDQITRWVMLGFGTDTGIVHALYHFEANRVANSYKVFRFKLILDVLIFALGGAVFDPIYLFLLYVLSPIETFKGSEHRLINVSYLKPLLPLLAICYYVPHLGSHLASDLMMRQKLAWTYQANPLLRCLGHWLLAKFWFRDTLQSDRVFNTKRDLKYIRVTMTVLCFTSCVIWLYTLYYAPYTFFELFLPAKIVGSTLDESMRALLQWDELIINSSFQLWILYAFSDLKKAGMMDDSWLWLVLIQLVAYVFGGPGVALAVGWWKREEVLASKRHKGAVIKDGIKRKTL